MSYIEFVRGTPLMIQVMFVYFGIGIFIDIPALISRVDCCFLELGGVCG